MKPAPFDFVSPRTLGEAVSLLKEHKTEAKLIAGGQSLMPLLNMRLARPGILIDLSKVADVDHIREIDGGLAIGAMTRQRAVEHSPMVKSRQPLLHEGTRFIAHPQIRNRGTIGGSLAHADPAAVYPAVAVALGAELRVVGPAGERTIDAGDFFVSYLTTALEPDEVLTEVRFPALAARTGWSFMEISRRHGDFALTGIAATVTLKNGGQCSAARIVLFGVGATPVRAWKAEQVIVGEKPSDKLLEQAAERVNDDIDEPLSDIHASAEYRRHLSRVLARRGLAAALERAAAAK